MLAFCCQANFNRNLDGDDMNDLGKIIEQRRLVLRLSLSELAITSGVSASHLGRIERRERFPSALILRKLAEPLGFEESELFSLAGYLSLRSPGIGEVSAGYGGRQLDPYVSRVLSQEPVEVQHTVVEVLNVLKSLTKGIKKE